MVLTAMDKLGLAATVAVGEIIEAVGRVTQDKLYESVSTVMDRCSFNTAVQLLIDSGKVERVEGWLYPCVVYSNENTDSKNDEKTQAA